VGVRPTLTSHIVVDAAELRANLLCEGARVLAVRNASGQAPPLSAVEIAAGGESEVR
jgi:hypothetical protein